MIKQKHPEWNVFDIIETQDSIQGKDDIDWYTMIKDYTIIIRYKCMSENWLVCILLCLYDLILYVPSTIFQLNRDQY